MIHRRFVPRAHCRHVKDPVFSFLRVVVTGVIEHELGLQVLQDCKRPQ